MEDAAAKELALRAAVGVCWGHLNTRHYRKTFLLARACLSIWPDEPRLATLYAFAALELREPVAPRIDALVRQHDANVWSALLNRRAVLPPPNPEPAC